MNYNYFLRQGGGKEICPNCGHKSFVPYINAEGGLINPKVGKCDRANNCRYHFPPRQYFAENAGEAEERKAGPKTNKPRPATTPSAPSFIDSEDFLGSLNDRGNNSLAIWLHAFFGSYIPSDEIDQVLSLYALGSNKAFGGSPVFWLIDSNGRIRDGKIMGYDKSNGKRLKTPRPLFTNIHSLLSDKYSGRFVPCYYGAHVPSLSDELHSLPIWLFESEKAALIVALMMQWGKCWLGVPMASAGCETFNPSEDHKREKFDRLQSLRNKKVVLFPDQGKFAEWKEKGSLLKGFCKEVYISSVMERDLHPHKIKCEIEEGDGFDDLIIRYLKKEENVFNLILTSYGYKNQWKLC